MIDKIFGAVPVCLIGAHAAAAYAPERMTQDIDYFVEASLYETAADLLELAGYRKDGNLTFATSALGLFGSRWIVRGTGQVLDLISSEQSWAAEAFREPAQFTKEGSRVIPLAYLVLMKLDAARSIDQGDLSRMLGRLSDREIDLVAAIVERHYGHDSAAIEDVRQYAEVGRWEYETPNSAIEESP